MMAKRWVRGASPPTRNSTPHWLPAEAQKPSVRSERLRKILPEQVGTHHPVVSNLQPSHPLRGGLALAKHALDPMADPDALDFDADNSEADTQKPCRQHHRPEGCGHGCPFRSRTSDSGRASCRRGSPGTGMPRRRHGDQAGGSPAPGLRAACESTLLSVLLFFRARRSSLHRAFFSKASSRRPVRPHGRRTAERNRALRARGFWTISSSRGTTGSSALSWKTPWASRSRKDVFTRRSSRE